MWRRFTSAACCLAFSAVIRVNAAPTARPYTVENYDVSVRADLAKQRLYGEAAIRLRGRGDNAVSAIEMDGAGLKIMSVRADDVPQTFEQSAKGLFVVLTRPVHPDEQRTLTVSYEASPAPGLEFFPDQVVASTVSDWMPCDDSAGERATLHLILTVPTDTKVAASGKFAGAKNDAGQTISEWRLDSPAEPGRFGFALGAFSETTSESAGIKLRVLGAGKEVSDSTGPALQYLAERTGKPYQNQTYTQVFTRSAAAASFAGGLTLMPDSYVDKIEKEPGDLWLLADLAAQQWFGIGITTKDWSDLWLSEGVSAFLADEFLEQKFGKQRFDLELAHARQTYDQLRLEGKDRPLSDTDWNTRQEADGGIPENKGAWFLYLLSQMTGEGPFASALKLYVANEWGHAATSEDFQRAFETVKPSEHSERKKEASAGRKKTVKDLDQLFDQWVYGVVSVTPNKSRR